MISGLLLLEEKLCGLESLKQEHLKSFYDLVTLNSKNGNPVTDLADDRTLVACLPPSKNIFFFLPPSTVSPHSLTVFVTSVITN